MAPTLHAATELPLVECATSFIDSTGFTGVAPTPKEAAYTVSEARRLTSYSS